MACPSSSVLSGLAVTLKVKSLTLTCGARCVNVLQWVADSWDTRVYPETHVQTATQSVSLASVSVTTTSSRKTPDVVSRSTWYRLDAGTGTDLTAALRRLTENIIRNEKRWRLIYTGGLFREMHEF